MKLRAIRLTNFRQHADTTIEFGTGITGIIGPNGTGKTTILEAIAWALYGNEAARGRRDSIRFVRADAKAPVRVDLEFDLGGHRYRVVRGLTSAELYLDGAEHPIANSLTAVSEHLQRRIGMSRSEFFNTYFTGQKELSVMTSLGPTERAQFLSRVLGYERLRTAQDSLRDRRRALTSELSGLKQGMPDAADVARELAEAGDRRTIAQRESARARDARTGAERALTDVAPQWETAQRERALYQQAATDLRLAEQDFATRTRDADRVALALAESEAAAAEIDAITPRLAPLPDLNAERDTLDTMFQNEGRRQTLEASAKAADDDLAQLVEKRARLADAPRLEEETVVALEAARAVAQSADSALEGARSRWHSDRQDAKTKLEEKRAQYAEVRAQCDRLATAGDGGECPTCLRPLGTHFRGVLDLLQEQLETMKVDGNYWRGRHEQLQTQPAEVTQMEEMRRAAATEVSAFERRVAAVQADVRELADLERRVSRQAQRVAGMRAELAALPAGYDAARHAVVRAELGQLAPLAQQAAKLAVLADRLSQVRAESTIVVGAREFAAQRVHALRDAVAAHPADDASHDALRAAFDTATKALAAASLASASAEVAATAADHAFARAQASREALARTEKKFADMTIERRLHDELDEAYTSYRTDLNMALRPELSGAASGFISEITDGRYGQLDIDDSYNLIAVEDGVPKPVISGGEEDVANLVLRLAISQMIANRTGQPFSLLILDEIFGSLDDARREHVIELLRALRDQFEQVILITHIQEVRFGCDAVLRVTLDRDTGKSVVERDGDGEELVEALEEMAAS